MTAENREDLLKAELAGLRDEHRRLDAEIRELEERAISDRLGLQRMKKRKLALKDRIALLEDQLYPDIIA
jgi:hypothetical protein